MKPWIRKQYFIIYVWNPAYNEKCSNNKVGNEGWMRKGSYKGQVCYRLQSSAIKPFKNYLKVSNTFIVNCVKFTVLLKLSTLALELLVKK